MIGYIRSLRHKAIGDAMARVKARRPKSDEHKKLTRKWNTLPGKTNLIGTSSRAKIQRNSKSLVALEAAFEIINSKTASATQKLNAITILSAAGKLDGIDADATSPRPTTAFERAQAANAERHGRRHRRGKVEKPSP